MDFIEDRRGVSELVGFIVLFGFLVILLSIWQAQVVPTQNSQTEISHYKSVQEDMLQLRSDYIDAAEAGATRSVLVQLGVRYPTRLFFVNGPDPEGQVRTEMPSNGTITADGFNVSRVCGLNSPVKTRSIVVNTDYQYYSDSESPPYVYENTVLFRQQPNGTAIFETDQTLVQGSTLNLYPLISTISQSGIETASIDFMGANTGEIEVSGAISVTIPTTLSAEQWRDLLEEEPKFDSVEQVGPQRVKISLASASWNVQCAAVSTEQTPEVNIPEPDPVLGNGTGAFRIDWQDPFGQAGTEAPCDSERCVWNVSSDTDDILFLTGSTTPKVEEIGVQFGVNNSSVATVSSADETTGSNGFASINLKAQANGSVAVYVATGGSSDVINITVIGYNSTSSNQPPTADFEINPGKNKNFKELNATSSTDTDGTIVSYEWDTDNDGQYDDATGQTVQVQEKDLDNGDIVSLRVTDNDGATDTISKTVGGGQAAIGVGIRTDRGDISVVIESSAYTFVAPAKTLDLAH